MTDNIKTDIKTLKRKFSADMEDIDTNPESKSLKKAKTGHFPGIKIEDDASLFSRICTLPSFSSLSQFENKDNLPGPLQIEKTANPTGLPFNPIEDILKKHHVALPKNANVEALTPLIKKLHTAIIYAHRTLCIGSSNKISDLKKVCSVTSNYVKNLRNDRASQKIFYIDLHLSCHVLDDILKHPQTLKNHTLFKFSNDLFFAEKSRVGNCSEECAVLADYLWRFPGQEIESVEVVGADDFDHVWAIINRKKGSSLFNSSEWGANCWIADGWWKEEGVFYSAEKYAEKMFELLEFMIQQYEWIKNNKIRNVDAALDKCKAALNRYRSDFKTGKLRIPISIKDNIYIEPSKNPYPLNKNFTFASCYDAINFTPLKALHKEKFKKCLEQIAPSNSESAEIKKTKNSL